MHIYISRQKTEVNKFHISRADPISSLFVINLPVVSVSINDSDLSLKHRHTNGIDIALWHAPLGVRSPHLTVRFLSLHFAAAYLFSYLFFVFLPFFYMHDSLLYLLSLRKIFLFLLASYLYTSYLNISLHFF